MKRTIRTPNTGRARKTHEKVLYQEEKTTRSTRKLRKTHEKACQHEKDVTRARRRTKRAGTSHVNAAVHETIIERQVHFQSSD